MELTSQAPLAPQLGDPTILIALVVAGAIGLLLGANGLLFGIPFLKPTPPATDDKKRVPWAVRVLLTLAPLMVLAVVLASSRLLTDRGRLDVRTPGGPTAAPAGTDGSSGAAALILVCVVVLVAGVVLSAALFRRRAPILVLETGSRIDDAILALDEGLGALLAESDPRKAVIAAYVAMERALTREGWARHAHEAPTEYLVRVLGVAPARARDLAGLVDLYEFARFSEHTVTAGMREMAIDSVRRLRADLGESP